MASGGESELPADPERGGNDGRATNRWIVWGFVAVAALSFLHWNSVVTFKLENEVKLVRTDGTKYFVYLPSLFLRADLDFADDIARLAPRSLRRAQFDRGALAKTTDTGLVQNWFPVGPAVLWSPFYLAALPFEGGSGYGPLAQLAVVFGSYCYGLAALVLTFATLRNFFKPWASFLGSLLVWAGGTVYYYSVFRGDMSHAPSAFMAALFLYLWFRFRERFGWLRAALLGVAAGLMLLVRAHNILIIAIPVVDSARRLLAGDDRRDWKSWAELSSRWAIAGLIAAAILATQFLIWLTVYGEPVPHRSTGFHVWDQPHAIEMLFSNNGIVSLTPLLGLSLIGLLLMLRRQPLIAATSLVVLLLMLYMYSSIQAWWGGPFSFGIRRFSNALPLFALGMAALLQSLRRLVERRPAAAAVVLVAPLLAWNFLSMSTINDRRLEKRVLSLVEIAELNLEQVYGLIGWPLSAPAALPFAAEYDVNPASYDLITGRTADKIKPNYNLVRTRAFFAEGWSQLQEVGGPRMKMEAPRARVVFSLIRPKRLRHLHFAVRCRPGRHEVLLATYLNGVRFSLTPLEEGMNERRVRLPLALRRAGVNQLVFAVLERRRDGSLRQADAPPSLVFHELYLQVAGATRLLRAAETGDPSGAR